MSDKEDQVDNHQSPSSSSSDSSSSDDDVEMDQEDEAMQTKLQTLNNQLSDQPTSYDLLVEKITLLQKMGELKDLRNTRSTLSRLYPLTPALWLAWIHDESSLVTDTTGKTEIVNLFELAVKDYQSVQIWTEYIQLLKDMGPDHISEARLVAERALASVGLHVLDGSLLWNAYRELELELLFSNSSDDQQNRCSSLSFRQLSVPLVGMEETYESVKAFTEIDPGTEQNYRTGLETLRKLEPWEKKLNEGHNSSEVYKEYIEFELKEKSNPARIVCLYERAVCDNALDSRLWLDYLTYTSTELKIGPNVLSVADRASRNCPWDMSIWGQWLYEIEKFSDPSTETPVKDAIKDVFERGLSYCSTGDQAGNLWLKYLQFLRRSINSHQSPVSAVEGEVELFMKTVTAAEDHLSQISPEPRPYIGEILFYGIRLQAHLTKSMGKARKLFYSALHKGYGQEFKLWIQFFQIEQRYGDVQSTRKCLEKAMSVMSDGLDTVAELWLNFERDFGDLKTLNHAEEKIGTSLGKKHETEMISKSKWSKDRNQFGKGSGRGNKGKKGPGRSFDQVDTRGSPKKRKFSGSANGDGDDMLPPSERQPKMKFEPKTPRRQPKSFVPRSLQVTSTATVTAAATAVSSTSSSNSDDTTVKKPLSNDDFRNLFKKPA